MKYKTKIVEIEAVLFNGTRDWHQVVPEWLIEATKKNPDVLGSLWVNDDGTANIHTLEGVMTANKGDYIIQGLKGELYPCKPDIFHMKYEIYIDVITIKIPNSDDTVKLNLSVIGSGKCQINSSTQQ